MLIDLIVGAVLGMVGAVLGLVPEWQPPSGMGSSMTDDVFWYAASANHVIPLWDLVLMIGLGLAWSLALMVWHFIVWVYQLIPFKMT